MIDRVKYKDIQNALNYLNADCDRDQWIKIGTAIKDAFPDQSGRDLFHRWSSGASSYKSNECDAQWRSFRPGRGSGQVSVATLFHFAIQSGYRPEKQSADSYKAPVTPKPSKKNKAKQEQIERDRRTRWRDRLWASTTDEATAKYILLYLRSRGLDPKYVPPNTRATAFHPMTGKPAIISAMHNELGELTAAHVIPLNHDGSKDACMTKKTAGFPSGACIWLNTPEEIAEAIELWLAEGLETAIAIQQIAREAGLKGVVVAAVGAAYNLPRQTPPPKTERIRLWIDKDDSQTGEKLALRCIDEYPQQLTLHVPPMALKPGQKSVDWLDWFNEKQAITPGGELLLLALNGEGVIQVEVCYQVTINARSEDIERLRSLRDSSRSKQAKNKYLPPFEIDANTRLLCLHASLGSGKTSFLEEQFQQARRAVAFSPRILLTNQMAERFGVLNYLDHNKHKIKADKVACTINSATRIDITEEGRVKPLDILAFDEPEQSLPVVFGNDMLMKNESGPLYEHLRHLTRNSRLVTLTDAFLSQETISSVQRMMGISDDQVQIVRHHYVDPESEFVILPNKAHFLQKTFDLLSKEKRLAIACTGREDAKATEKEIRDRFSDKKVLCIHADSDKFTRTTLSNPNESWSEYDVVIWSPTVSSGVSFDVPDHFDHVMLFARSIPGIGWTDLMQMVARPRHPRSKLCYAYVDKNQYRRAVRRETIREQALKGIEETTHLLRLEADDEGRVTRHPINEEHFESWCDLEAVGRRRCNNVKRSLLSYLRRSGYKVIEVKEYLGKEKQKETGGAFETSKKQNKEERYSQIYNSPDISMAEAESIRQSHWATVEERQAAKKASIKHDFGFVTPELIKRCEGHEKLKRKIRNLTHGLLWIKGERRFFERKDRIDFESGFDKHLKHYLMTGRFLGELLECLNRHLYPDLLRQLNIIQDLQEPLSGPLSEDGELLSEQGVAPAHDRQISEKEGFDLPAHENTYSVECLINQGRVRVESKGDSQVVLESVYVTKQDLEANEAFKEELAQILRLENREAVQRVGLQLHPDDLNKQVGCILNVFGIKRKSKEITGRVRAYCLNAEGVQEQLLLTATYYHRVCRRIRLEHELDVLLDDVNPCLHSYQDSNSKANIYSENEAIEVLYGDCQRE